MKTRKLFIETKNTRMLDKARSLKDILKVVTNIDEKLKKSNKALKILFKSIASTQKLNFSLSGDSSIDISNVDTSHISVDTESTRKKANRKKSMEPVVHIAPNKAKLRKNFEIIENLSSTAEELDMARSAVYQNHGSASEKETRAARKAIDALLKSVDKQLEDAYVILNVMASKHVPSKLQEYVNSIVEYLHKRLDINSYESISPFVYVVPDNKVIDGNGIAYSYYIKISKLRASDEFVYNDYYVILTCDISTKTGLASYYINTYSEFYRPGDYDFGVPIENNVKARRALDTMMARDDIVATMFRQKLPLDTQDIRRAGINSIPGVRASRMQNNSLFVGLYDDATVAEKNRIIKEVTVRLKSIFRNGKSSLGKSTFKTKISTGKQTRSSYIQFILAPSNHGEYKGTITQGQIDALLEGLNFEPESSRDLRKAILRMGMKVEN